MVMNERLIKFPVPDWNRIISPEFDSIAYCLCYQYDINSDNFGPYGFYTTNSSEIINNIFPNLFFYGKNTANNKEELVSTEEINKKGIYLYGNIDKIKFLQAELDNYFLSQKKNEIRLRKNLTPIPLLTMPMLLDLGKKSEYSSDDIKNLINSGCSFFILHHYMPQAGDSIILFDHSIKSDLVDAALKYNIDFLEVDSINTLKAW